MKIVNLYNLNWELNTNITLFLIFYRKTPNRITEILRLTIQMIAYKFIIKLIFNESYKLFKNNYSSKTDHFNSTKVIQEY